MDKLRGTAMDQLREQQWQQLPAKIILLRHGQAEHNLDPTILQEDNPNRKPDNLCELTSLGRSQARDAGERIRKLLGNRGVISVIVSPFERTQQTLYALQQELGDVEVRRVHIDSRVREQEFGNFQRDMAQLGKDANEVRKPWLLDSNCDPLTRASSCVGRWGASITGGRRARAALTSTTGQRPSGIPSCAMR